MMTSTIGSRIIASKRFVLPLARVGFSFLSIKPVDLDHPQNYQISQKPQRHAMAYTYIQM